MGPDCKRKLQELSHTIDESLELLKKAEISNRDLKQSDFPVLSLLDQCVELCEQHQEQCEEEIRMIRYFPLPDNNVLLTSLATLANTQVINDFHPDNPRFYDILRAQTVSVKSSAGDNTQTYLRDNTLKHQQFIRDLEQRQQQSSAIGQRLLLCECYPAYNQETRTDLLALVSAQFRIKALLFVCDPMLSYSAYCQQNSRQATGVDFEYYCQTLVELLDQYTELALVRYEDFIDRPEATLQMLCKYLNLPFNEQFELLREVFVSAEELVLNDDCTVQIIGGANYRTLCERLGYDSDNPNSLQQYATVIKNEVDSLSNLARTPSLDAKIAVLQTEVELLHHELSLAQQRGQLFYKGGADSLLDMKESVASKAWISGLKQRAVSQLGQDLWVLEMLNYKYKGFFVEFGATDGVLLSNTYLLEKEFDWNGICAEPNPKFFGQLTKNRQCLCKDICIAGVDGETREFILADAFGSLAAYEACDQHMKKRHAYRESGKVINVKTQTLDSFLRACRAPQEIDYISIDTEGSELEILQAFDLNVWQVKLLTVEHNYQESSREKIRALLAGYGYRVKEAQWDDWFWRDDLLCTADKS